MRKFDEPDGFDVVAPMEPVTVSLEISPDEIELALATNGETLRNKLLSALIFAMIDDQTLAGEAAREARVRFTESAARLY